MIRYIYNQTGKCEGEVHHTNVSVVRSSKTIGTIDAIPSGMFCFFPSPICTGLTPDDMKDILNRLESLNTPTAE